MKLYIGNLQNIIVDGYQISREELSQQIYSNLAAQIDIAKFALYMPDYLRRKYKKYLEDPANKDMIAIMAQKQTSQLSVPEALSYPVLVQRIQMKEFCKYLTPRQVQILKKQISGS